MPDQPAEPVPAGVDRPSGRGRRCRAVKALQPKPEKQEYSGQTYVRGTEGTGPFCFLADERTVVVCDREEHLRRLIVAGKNGASKAKWADAWKGAENADIAAAGQYGRDSRNAESGRGNGPPMMNRCRRIAPLWQCYDDGLPHRRFRRTTSGIVPGSGGHRGSAMPRRSADTLAAVGHPGTERPFAGPRPIQSASRCRRGGVPGAADMLDSLLDSVKIEQQDGSRCGRRRSSMPTMRHRWWPCCCRPLLAREAARRHRHKQSQAPRPGHAQLCTM